MAARGLLTLLIKTRKVLRLYDRETDVSQRLESRLAAAASEYLERWGPCEVTVSEDRLHVGGEEVYRSGTLPDDLPYVLYRDGIRSLTLLPGLKREELHDLLVSINRGGRRGAQVDDLVTILWEMDLEHVHYIAVEELAGEPRGNDVAHRLATAGGGGGTVATVDLDRIRTPRTCVPLEACNLTPDEARELRRELSQLDDLDMERSTVELAVDLTLLSPDDGDRAAVAHSLVRVLDRMMADGDIAGVIRVLGILDDLADVDMEELPEVAGLRDRVLSDLACPDRVVALLDGADVGGFPPESLSFLLLRLGDEALATTVDRLGTLQSVVAGQVAGDVIHAAGTLAVEQLLARLEGEDVNDPDLVRAVLGVVGRLCDEERALIVERLLATSETQLRRRAVGALGPFQDGAIGAIWLRLLADPDEQVRRQAVDAFVRCRDPEAARHLMRRAETREFRDGAVEETRQLMIAIGRLARDRSLAWFEQLLTTVRAGWFASRRKRDLVAAAVLGVHSVDSPAARELLERLSHRGKRQVRASCREVLRGNP